MCRLLGIVAREPQGFRRCLREDRRSLAVLGREHNDGWGIAVHDSKAGWKVTKQCTGAGSDPAFDAAASDAKGALIIAHVRKRTVGDVSFNNTHPFRHHDWVFAHNGTIERVAELRAAIGSTVSTPLGNTDSELLFAFLMDRLASHPRALGSRIITDMVLSRAVEDLARMPSLGTATFVLSDGAVLYAYRLGPPLYLLERRLHGRPEAILVASEPVTSGEHWMPIAERTLLTVWRRPRFGWGVMLEPQQSPTLGTTLETIRPDHDAESPAEGRSTRA
jgi:predicted glutamine amidotransferase